MKINEAFIERISSITQGLIEDYKEEIEAAFKVSGGQLKILTITLATVRGQDIIKADLDFPNSRTKESRTAMIDSNQRPLPGVN